MVNVISFFNQTDKIRIYSADFDLEGCVPVRDLTFESDSIIRFVKSDGVFRIFFTEINLFDHVSRNPNLIYVDEPDHIYDILMSTYDIPISDFVDFLNCSDDTLYIEASKIKLELVTFQHVSGDKDNRKLISRKLLMGNSNGNYSFSSCPDCKGQKKIFLFTGFVDCDRCS